MFSVRRMRSSADDMGHPVLCPAQALLTRIPLGPRPWLRRLRSREDRLRSPTSQLLWRGPTSHSRASSASAFPPSRCGPGMRQWSDVGSPGSRTRSVRTCQGLRPRRAVQVLALSHPCVLPSAALKASALEVCFFRGSMAGLCVPLPTLRPCPCGQRRTARGRCGSLLLHRSGLAPPTPRRSPGALVPKQSRGVTRCPGLLRRFAPRNDGKRAGAT